MKNKLKSYSKFCYLLESYQRILREKAKVEDMIIKTSADVVKEAKACGLVVHDFFDDSTKETFSLIFNPAMPEAMRQAIIEIAEASRNAEIVANFMTTFNPEERKLMALV